MRDDFANRKWSEEVRRYAHQRCVKAHKEGQISIPATAFLTKGYLEGKRKEGKKVTIPAYVPCKSLEVRSFPFY